jgi:hypothetical protein
MSKPQSPVWSEGVCGDGAAILRDGVMVPIEEVVRELNSIAELREDAERFRWLLNGRGILLYGYFMEAVGLCRYVLCSEREQQAARDEIDKYRVEDGDERYCKQAYLL